MNNRYMSAAEVNVLDGMLPPGLTPDMRDVALCLYEALVLEDDRAGQNNPLPVWAEQLAAWARQVLLQLQHLAEQKGGRALYLAKGVAVYLSARDREICAKFRGNNYRELAQEHNLTEMRVRQIVDTFQRDDFLKRQSSLPGLGAPDIS